MWIFIRILITRLNKEELMDLKLTVHQGLRILRAGETIKTY